VIPCRVEHTRERDTTNIHIVYSFVLNYTRTCSYYVTRTFKNSIFYATEIKKNERKN